MDEVDPWNACEGGAGKVFLKAPSLEEAGRQLGGNRTVKNENQFGGLRQRLAAFDNDHDAVPADYAIIAIIHLNQPLPLLVGQSAHTDRPCHRASSGRIRCHRTSNRHDRQPGEPMRSQHWLALAGQPLIQPLSDRFGAGLATGQPASKHLQQPDGRLKFGDGLPLSGKAIVGELLTPTGTTTLLRQRHIHHIRPSPVARRDSRASPCPPPAQQAGMAPPVDLTNHHELSRPTERCASCRGQRGRRIPGSEF